MAVSDDMSAAKKCRITAFNSLDERYGSTYRMRALCRILAEAGHQVNYKEGKGGNFSRLLAGISASLERDSDLFFIQKFNPVTLPAILLSRMSGKTVLVDWDDIDTDLQGTWIRRYLTAICERVGPRFASQLTTHSEILKKRAEDLGLPVHIVSQGFDESLHQYSEEGRREYRHRWNAGENDGVVAFMGTLTYGGAMDLDVLLRAWAKIDRPDFCFVIIGGGPLEGRFRKTVSDLGLGDRVRFTGLLPQTEIPRALSAVDVATVFMSDRPSNRARVSFKVIEYLAMNLPVVGKIVGETRERFGNFVTLAEEGDLPRKIVEMRERRPRLETRNKVTEYAWSRIASQMEHALQQAMLGGRTCH